MTDESNFEFHSRRRECLTDNKIPEAQAHALLAVAAALHDSKQSPPDRGGFTVGFAGAERSNQRGR